MDVLTKSDHIKPIYLPHSVVTYIYLPSVYHSQIFHNLWQWRCTVIAKRTKIVCRCLSGDERVSLLHSQTDCEPYGWRVSQARNQQNQMTSRASAGSFFRFLSDPEDGSDIFLRDVRLCPNFTVLEQVRPHPAWSQPWEAHIEICRLYAYLAFVLIAISNGSSQLSLEIFLSR